jgi:GntR family transcriptional repressor for pyruvate dehydrogenase complex
MKKLNPKPIKKERLFEITANTIETMIRNGVYKINDRLPSERELVSKFQVSRHTIREALNKLQNEGLLKVIPGKGTFVLEPNVISLMHNFTKNMLLDKDKLICLFEVRQVIETQAAKFAALRADDRDIDNICDALKLSKEQEEKNDNNEIDPDIDFFHNSVVEASHNPVLVHVAKAVFYLFKQSMINRKVNNKNSIGKYPASFYDDHVKIFNNILKRDDKAAEIAMRQHLDNVLHKHINGYDDM